LLSKVYVARIVSAQRGKIDSLPAPKKGFRRDLTLLSLIALISAQVDKFILSTEFDPIILGEYALLTMFASLIAIPQLAINPILPILMQRSGDKLLELYRIYTWIMFASSSLIIILIYHFKDDYFSYFNIPLTDQYSLLLKIFLAAHVVNILTGPSGVFLKFLNYEFFDVKINFLVLFVATSFLILTIGKYGIYAAAITAFLNSIIINIVRVIILKHVLCISQSHLYYLCGLAWLIYLVVWI
jgi:hypothetical protein